MKITNLENGNISIVTPYNKDFVDRIKKLGGRWNAGDKAWEIDERSIECQEFSGWTAAPKAGGEQ